VSLSETWYIITFSNLNILKQDSKISECSFHRKKNNLKHTVTSLKLLESNGKFEIPLVFEGKTEAHIEEDLDFGYCEALKKGKKHGTSINLAL